MCTIQCNTFHYNIDLYVQDLCYIVQCMTFIILHAAVLVSQLLIAIYFTFILLTGLFLFIHCYTCLYIVTHVVDFKFLFIAVQLCHVYTLFNIHFYVLVVYYVCALYTQICTTVVDGHNAIFRTIFGYCISCMWLTSGRESGRKNSAPIYCINTSVGRNVMKWKSNPIGKLVIYTLNPFIVTFFMLI